MRGASNCKRASVVCGQFVVVAVNRSSGNIRTGIDNIAVVSNVNDNRIAAAQICCACSKRLLRVTRVRSRLFADKFYLQFALFNCQRRSHVGQLLEVGIAADKFCRNGVRTDICLIVADVRNSNAVGQVGCFQAVSIAVVGNGLVGKHHLRHVVACLVDCKRCRQRNRVEVGCRNGCRDGIYTCVCTGVCRRICDRCALRQVGNFD